MEHTLMIVNGPGLSQLTLATLLQSLASFVCLVYISLALGCGAVAFVSELISMLSGNSGKSEIAAKCSQIASTNMGVNFLLGVVPVLTLYLTYSQFLFDLNTPVTNYFILSAIFNFIGLSFLNHFRVALNVKKFVHEGEEAHEIVEHAKATKMISGLAGVIFLLIGGFFLIGGAAVAVDPTLWEHGFVVILTSIQVWLKFAAFVFGSIAVAGAAMIFFFLSWDGGYKFIGEDVKHSAIVCGASLAIFATPLYALFTGLHLKFIPRADFSLCVIGFSALAIIMLFFALHMVYYSMAHKHTGAGIAGLVLVMIGFLFVVLADNSTRENALRKHSHELNKKYGGSGHSVAKH